jgi:hypothetical protein
VGRTLTWRDHQPHSSRSSLALHRYQDCSERLQRTTGENRVLSKRKQLMVESEYRKTCSFCRFQDFRWPHTSIIIPGPKFSFRSIDILPAPGSGHSQAVYHVKVYDQRQGRLQSIKHQHNKECGSWASTGRIGVLTGWAVALMDTVSSPANKIRRYARHYRSSPKVLPGVSTLY